MGCVKAQLEQLANNLLMVDYLGCEHGGKHIMEEGAFLRLR